MTCTPTEPEPHRGWRTAALACNSDLVTVLRTVLLYPRPHHEEVCHRGAQESCDRLRSQPPRPRVIEAVTVRADARRRLTAFINIDPHPGRDFPGRAVRSTSNSIARIPRVAPKSLELFSKSLRRLWRPTCAIAIPLLTRAPP